MVIFYCGVELSTTWVRTSEVDLCWCRLIFRPQFAFSVLGFQIAGGREESGILSFSFMKNSHWLPCKSGLLQRDLPSGLEFYETAIHAHKQLLLLC